MSQITTHVLDTALGLPAAGIKVSLLRPEEGKWMEITRGITDSDGRIGDLLKGGKSLDPGAYRLVFQTDDYFEKTSRLAFYPEISITFRTIDREHYHVPLLLNPFGYSTYRGS